MVMMMVIFAKCRSQVSERGSIATYNISLHRGGIFHDFRKAVRSSYFILKHIAVPYTLVMCYRNQWVQTINAKTITTIVELGNQQLPSYSFVVLRSRSSGPTRWSSWRIFLSRLPVSKVVNVIRKPFNQSPIKIDAVWVPYTETHFIIIIGLTEYFLVPYYRCRFEMTGTSVNPLLNCTEYNTVVGVQTTP